MAGHSKWANIKHRKAAQDAKRGKIFTKLIREITVAAKGGPDPADNPRLRAAVDKALQHNMKKDTIDKAIARGAGTDGQDNYEELTYEGYGAGGVAVYVEAMTDNRNRTVAEVRHAFSKHGGNLGTDGSVAYLFSKKGVISEDVVTNDDGSVEVRTLPEDFEAVREALKAAGLAFEEAEVTMVPSTTVELDVDTARAVLKMIDMLEDLDDVQNVYTNADIPEEAYEG